MSITSLSIKRPTLIVVIFSVFTLLGIVSYFSIGYELLPKFSQPVISISTSYPGASPSEVETGVTKKIEDAISSVEKLDAIRSTSFEGMSSIIVQFQSTVDLDQALQEAQRKVNSIAANLPEQSKDPVISKFSADEAAVMKLSVTAKTENRELYDIVNQRIKPVLSKLDGMADVGIMGGEEREIRVNIDRKRIELAGLDVQQVLKAIHNSNLDFLRAP